MQPWDQTARVLLFSTRPVPHETPVSYLRRLATDNDVESLTLLQNLAAVRRNPHHTDDALFNPSALTRLETMTGRTRDTLQQAMPTLRQPHAVDDPTPKIRLIPARNTNRPHPACRPCMARRDIQQAVVVHLPEHVNLCPDHGIWLRNIQLDIAAVPELSRAQRDHHRLAHRHPDDRLKAATRTAEDILHGWSQHPLLASRWLSRQRLLDRDEQHHFLPEYAQQYPELIALTAMIASPHWSRLAVGTADDEDRFLHEANRRLGLNSLHRAPDHDPLLRWISTRKRHRKPQQQSDPLRIQTLTASQRN